MDIAEFEQRLHDAEVRLARLKALYEQWFQGIERIEPQIARKELERSLELLKREQPRNTALRFRCQQLSARYGTYGIYWGRIAKQIEEGTYRRDLQRARARAQAQRARETEQRAYDVEVELDGLEAGFGDSDLDAILGALGAPSAPPPASARDRAEPSTEPAPPPASVAPQARSSVSPPRPPALTAQPAAPASPTAAPGAPRVMSFAPPGGARGSATFAKPAGDAPPKPPAVPQVRPPPVPSMRAPAPGQPPAPSMRAPVPGQPPAPSMRAPAPPLPPPRAPAAAPAPGPDMRALYERYVDARRRNNERVDNVRLESLQQSVEKMMPKLREKHGNKSIDFDVVVQDGKVGLKPRVR
ncbi:MAG: MXAN_5187 C-terminal domain-containing protein [Deltaproteobacteria bacterium]|jgi:hypothetical protein